MRLANKTAIVTGAARGLGRACAQKFAEQGADLVLLDIARDIPEVGYALGSLSQLQHTARLCERFGVVVQIGQVDVRDMAQIEDAVQRAVERFGKVDVLLNNAGIAAPSGKAVHDISEPEWQLMLDVDLSGAWRMIKAVGGLMADQRSGSIINIASTAGIVGYRHFSGYVAAKHGLIGLSKAAALDYAPLQVRVNTLCPGSVRDAEHVEGRMLSEIAKSLSIEDAEYEQAFLRSQPMNMLMEPEDVAASALWLASDESVRITGSVITVDGGFSAR